MPKTERLIPREPIPPTQFSLEIYDPKMNITAPLSRSTLYVGSGSDNDLILKDPHVSKNHARITQNTEGHWLIEDLKSTNGTKLNQRQIIKSFLAPGDTLSIAGYALIVTSNPKDSASDIDTLTQKLGVTITTESTLKVFQQAYIYAQTKENICLFGETGTGKDVLANFIHMARYKRARNQFLAINMTALPESLMEFELFGAKKGSFTGATQDSQGIFESAENGTVFLDEIGDLSLSLQPKLLRVLENQEIRRIGEGKTRKVHCSIIFATHQNLKTQVTDKKFREDLYHRICILPLTLPPLRERPQEIISLVDRFLPPNLTCHEQTIIKLKEHPFPGNIRELKNVITRASILAQADNRVEIQSDDILFL